MGELASQALILVGEFTVAAQRNVEALAQRVVGGALPDRCRGGVSGLVVDAQAPDLVFEIGLSVEPGAGDASVVGYGFEVIFAPVRSSSCRAAMALARVTSCRCLAAVLR